MQCVVNTFNGMTMLHWDLIPDDESSFAEQLMMDIMLFDVASASIMNRNGNSETGVCSASTIEKERCNPR